MKTLKENEMQALEGGSALACAGMVAAGIAGIALAIAAGPSILIMGQALGAGSVMIGLASSCAE